eukprot:m.132379 g.132379  ORF g.132379 m.132379 type:complete len:71 (+) comp13793_c0_seq5:256-468(+)
MQSTSKGKQPGLVVEAGCNLDSVTVYARGLSPVDVASSFQQALTIVTLTWIALIFVSVRADPLRWVELLE